MTSQLLKYPIIFVIFFFLQYVYFSFINENDVVNLLDITVVSVLFVIGMFIADRFFSKT